jgi:ceramide glucosyltransferase
LPWALLALVATRAAPWSVALFAIALILRVAVAMVVGRSALQDRFVLRLLSLVLLRDLVAVVVWCASFASDTISWRGSHFHLRDGTLSPADS